MSDELILGIDGGGSKVFVALADRSGRILRSARGRGVNPMDNPNWLEELEQHLLPFHNEPKLMAVAAGLPAYGEVARLSALQRDAIQRGFPNALRQVLNDVDAAHLGAFGGKPGILILSGTGSMAWARNAAGSSARIGGWGDLIGDEGSSHWIGQRALNLISQGLDGRAAATALATALFDHLGINPLDPMNGLGDWASALLNPRAEIAAISALVDRVGCDGDAGAIGLLEQAADELSKHHRAISGHCDANADWTYAGGTFSSRLLLGALERRIGKPPAPPKLPPIGGALLAAAQLLDWPLDESWFGQIAATAQSLGAHAT
ncbi:MULTISPECIES: BadF/BadG/BcrA/BcrD ATPase family protein [unclassified Rhizobium]|uniref:N-acetylglucosamine kinase n=1 Tax=unclassified Rhizobium TaxID=2613769 RepID=UPI001A996FC9|nr:MULTISPECIES: BadF/BadG/BcrA/BcrD ATPase family protein [unclassified Rhizobium]MBX5162231.1 N-acetylglucosamine kinase [Rhizobium sp. NZLR4b]MBX5174622.1 N-acetylglucosamine kinase [Rhizobium sp. NZLR1b]MBX5181385.1 N-acetylglucosamine kinase [Rhizobium sp. NZLR5]MBX5199337.1 N-acetylglucosamine kinase [Rhizobium sp. NZLR10]MBX5200745.1 N-acetylglucosamine kinase [Rhizobium sp. NZLR1]